jgi:hypothetical protein
MPSDQPAGATMRFWLANTCKELREQADVRPETVAATAGLSAGQLWRFEAHENWPRHFDRIVWAYATILGADDPRDIWQLALDRWKRHGTVPVRGDGPAVRQFTQVVRDQAKRDRAQFRREPGGMPTSKPTRKAAGG